MACNIIGSSYEHETNLDFEETGLDVNKQRQVYEDYHQQVFSKNEDEVDRRACNMTSNVDHINLRKSSKKEINQIIVDMVAQVQSNYGLRNRIVSDKSDKSSSIFMKYITHKMAKCDKE